MLLNYIRYNAATHKPERFAAPTRLSVQSAIDYVKNLHKSHRQFSDDCFTPVAARMYSDAGTSVVSVSVIHRSYEDGALRSVNHIRDCWHVWEVPQMGSTYSCEPMTSTTPVKLYGEW